MKIKMNCEKWIIVVLICLLLICIFCMSNCNILNWITVAGSIWACSIAYSQLQRMNTTDSNRFLIELRNAFSEERRWKVHQAIYTNDNIYLADHLDDVNDYLGLFEICEEMIANKSLDQGVFEKLYLYRLRRIMSNEFVVNYLEKTSEDWVNFYNLIKRFPKLKEKFNESKSDSKGSISKTDDSASKTKNGLQFKKIEI